MLSRPVRERGPKHAEPIGMMLTLTLFTRAQVELARGISQVLTTLG